MKRRAAVVSLAYALLLCAACSAQMVSSATPSASQYAPLNENSRVGIIRYRNMGVASVRKARREDAYKQMYKSCGGPYRIVAEGERADGGHVVQTSPSESVSKDTRYMYIEYACDVGASPNP